MSPLFSLDALWQLFLYSLVSLGEFVGGYAIMKFMQDHRRSSRLFAFFTQSIIVGLVAFVLRKEIVFA